MASLEGRWELCFEDEKGLRSEKCVGFHGVITEKFILSWVYMEF